MKRILTALLALTAACAPGNEDNGEAASADSAIVSAPTATQPDTMPDTTAKSNAPAASSDSPPGTTASARSPSSGASPVAGQDRVRGIVRLTGTVMEPVTSIETPQGAVVVRGALERDVRSLSGAVVVILGNVSDGPPRSIDAESYSVIEIEGQPATAGIVASDARTLLVGSDTVALMPPPPGLQPGSHIWVTGPRTGNTVRVSSFGVIRPAP